jgi:DNA-binding NarL/FixJ family response regulator
MIVAQRARGANLVRMVADRVAQRRRAVALARHYRDAEGLSIRQIADRLGRSPATIKAYFGGALE